MAKLIYSALISLDGYIEDENGSFDWAVPDEKVHTFINELERQIGTYLYGRRMYEVMVGWETAHNLPDQPAYTVEFARIWQAANKIVFSKTLTSVASARTRIVRDFEPGTIRQMKLSSGRDISVGGPEIAAQAIRTGLVDEIHLFVTPILIGSGKPALPGQVRVSLELVDENRFDNGMVHLHYRLKR